MSYSQQKTDPQEVMALKRIMMIVCLMVLTVSAWSQNKIMGLVDELAVAAADLIAESVTDQGRVYLQGITLDDRATPLGELFTLKASNRVLSRSRGRALVIVDERAADFVLIGRAFELEDEILFGFSLVRNSDAAMIGGFDRTYPANRDLKQKLRVVPAGGDEWEPNDTPTDAVVVEIGQSVADLTLQPPRDIDWFRLDIEVVAGQALSVIVETTGDLDTYMEIYGPDNQGVLYTENDDGVDSNARILLSVEESATYWIKVRGYDSSAIGGYGLTTSGEAAIADEWEPDDDRARATSLRPGDEQRHSLIPKGDVDWYRIDIPSPSDTMLLTIETTGSIDTLMTLYSSQGEIVQEDDDSGLDGGNARISQVVQGRETYFAAVKGYEETFGPYVIVVSLDKAELDDYEPDDGFANAKMLTTDGRPQRHTFTSPSDEDYLTFEIQSDMFVVIETEGAADTNLQLYDEDQNLIAEDDDGGTDYNARVSAEIGAGKYFVIVTQTDDATQTEYTVKMARYRR